MDNNNLTFYELIDRYKVQIPIIQRDYAQGRPKNKSICHNFLLSIRDSLTQNNPINLDFIYGNIEDDRFQPIDGQQRLTTLFLLHWYALIKEESISNHVKDKLKNFTYETRLSSRRFCEALVSNSNHEYFRSQTISNSLQDSQWFFLSWKQDPTIRAMLNTIDMIHELFHDIDNLWFNLAKEKYITFHLLILENFGLSDDLYIKMNARGRLLTAFETLKAEIQGQVDSNGWESELATTDRFSHKIDTVWTDFLWNNFRKKDSIDSAHMNLITSLVMFKLSVGQKLRGAERIEVLRRLNENNSDRDLINYIDQDVFTYICKCYDLYVQLIKDDSIPKISFDMWRHRPEKNLLSQILVGENTSYTHRVLFFAQTEYLLRNTQIDKEKFLDWMRVVRNIVSRGDITKEGKRPDIVRSPEAFYGAINLINELANGSNGIYSYLPNRHITSSFAKDQVREEVLKAEIITQNEAQKALIFSTEDNELLRGKILFPLQCAGYVSQIEEIDFGILEKVKDVFEKYFNIELEPTSGEFDMLRRAMLTIEHDRKYRYYDYWRSYWNAGNSEKRKLFSSFREIEYFIGDKEFNPYFKKLVFRLFESSYEEILESFVRPDEMENWQFRLIKEPEHLEGCRWKYIAIPDDRSYCYLLKGKRPSSVEGSTKVE